MASIDKRPSGNYRVRWRDAGGRPLSKTFRRMHDAKAYKAQIETELMAGDYIDHRGGKRLLADWIDEWWAAAEIELRPSTVDRYERSVKNHIVPTLGGYRVNEIRTKDAQRLVSDLMAKGLAPATISGHVQVLKSVMNRAVHHGLITRNPCDGVTLPADRGGRMKFLAPEQIGALAEAVGAYYRPLVLTAAYTGLRWGELAGLHVENLNVLHRYIDVTEQITEVSGQLHYGPPKTSASRRRVILPAALAVALGDHLAGPAPCVSSGLVFPSPKGKPLRRTNFARRTFTPATKAVGIDPFTFHELRHTAASLAIRAGAHPKAIQERLGHSSITVTLDRYGHLFPQLQESIASGLDAFITAGTSTEECPESVPDDESTRSEPFGDASDLGVLSGANKNRTCDLTLIRGAL